MTRWAPATDADREAMLGELGLDSIDDLFRDIPPEVRLDRPLDIPDPLSEWELLREMAGLAERNADTGSELEIPLPRHRMLGMMP